MPRLGAGFLFCRFSAVVGIRGPAGLVCGQRQPGVGAVITECLRIFHIFRKYNILEFKNPDDVLSESVLWKVIGYAGFYIAKYGIPSEDVTLSFFRGAKPVKMFKEMAGFIVPDETKGIYHIKNWKVYFPIQIVVTTELGGKEYAGFRAISKKPRLEDIGQMIREAMAATDQKLIGWYRDFLEMFSKLDSEMMEKAKRRFPEMAKTWRDIFKPEIDEWINSAVTEGHTYHLFQVSSRWNDAYKLCRERDWNVNSGLHGQHEKGWLQGSTGDAGLELAFCR